MEQFLAILVLSILKAMSKNRKHKKAKSHLNASATAAPVENASVDAENSTETAPESIAENINEISVEAGIEAGVEAIATDIVFVPSDEFESDVDAEAAEVEVAAEASEESEESSEESSAEVETVEAQASEDAEVEAATESDAAAADDATETSETAEESTEEGTEESADAEVIELAPKRKFPVGGSIAIAAVSALLLSAWMVGPQAGTSAAIENRPVAKLPVVDANSMRSVDTYKQIESWAIDHVRVKPIAVSAVNSAIAAATKQSGSSLVIQGSRFSRSRDLELFSAEEFTARCRYPASIEKSRAALESIRAAAAAGNKKVMLAVVPSKAKTIGYLLGTRLNDLMGCAYNEDLVIAQLAREFPDVLKVVDPKRVLKYAPKDPYWSGDTHWTPMGGRALSELVLAQVANVDLPTARRILFDRTVPANKLVRGDLYRLLGFSKETATTRVATRPAYQLQITMSPFGTGSRVWGWTSPQPLEGATNSMIILHDSMVNVPRLTGQFGSVVPEGYDVHWSMAEDLPKLPQVETVVLEFVDRTFLSKLLSFPGVDDNVEDDTRMAAALTYLASS
ncbi:MAG: hydrolase-like domain, acetyltransferase AlgX [Actinomycetota bacterium]